MSPHIPKSEQARIRSAPKSEAEATVITARRMRKAERDERMDITRVLTPPKTYEGGFTRPTTIRHTHWLPGGYYTDSKTVYEAPSPAAYEPHTVFLLESRYSICHGQGQPRAHKHIVAVCREGDFVSALDKYNSAKAPGKCLEDMDNADWPWLNKSMRRAAKSRGHLLAVDTLTPTASTSSAQRSLFHSSSISLASDASESPPRTTPEERANIPTSSWARPHKPSQDADDNVVPTYYIERKRQRDTIAERKEEEGGLMAELSAGILSEGVAAQTKVSPEKIPVEVKLPDGSVVHPSGFEPPTAETDFHPMASKVATEDDPLVTTVKVTWDDALAPTTDDLVTSVAEASTASPSKFIRSFHTSAIARAAEIPELAATDVAPIPLDRAVTARQQYLSTLTETPFWRPILSLTFSTRPIAMSVARLSRGMERGTPFYATVPPEERRHCASFTSRMRSLRITRMQSLTSQLTQALKGERGGIFGLRSSPNQKGRGVSGEGFDSHVAPANRLVKVGVAEWHPLAAEIKESFTADAEKNGAVDVVEVFGIDEKGLRADGVAWTPVKPLNAFAASLPSQALTKEDKKVLTHAARKAKMDRYVKEHGKEVAVGLATKVDGVVYP
ncbi:hypothetical protein EUX98_g6927 [Antrodiella citrinella]|uniref:Uncharacterized protein n=1 Tax=Antrodiella citrinella TaxID=2447956 RepID=A0A4S4MMT7_9APHY|nr:hypothetical protein EUX98_g6927 [Antrodiella citrinella]